jgi:hypothetical protein
MFILFTGTSAARSPELLAKHADGANERETRNSTHHPIQCPLQIYIARDLVALPEQHVRVLCEQLGRTRGACTCEKNKHN